MDNVSIRLDAAAIRTIDDHAAKEKRKRGQMIRVLLDEALTHRAFPRRHMLGAGEAVLIPEHTVDERSIAEPILKEIPDWYRTDTPHIDHAHTPGGLRCLPDQLGRDDRD